MKEIHSLPLNQNLAGNALDRIGNLFNDERLLNLASALKTFHGNKVEAALPIFRHWARINYDIAWHREVEEGFLKIYGAAKPLKRAKALKVVELYSEHFFNTATADERAALAASLGATQVEYEIRTEGFSLRELMQALKTFHNVPDDLLIACFERYACEWHGYNISPDRMAQLIEAYRLEPRMKSIERAKAILKELGIRILNSDNPDDLQTWKEVSSAQEH